MDTATLRAALGALLLAPLFSSCSKPPLTPAALGSALKAAKWTYVDLPRALLGPGAIVQISKDSGISYKGHVSDCIDDPAVYAVVSGDAGLPTEFKVKYSTGADVVADYYGVEIGPKGNLMRSATMKLGPAKEIAISSVRVEKWLDENRANLGPACLKYLAGDASQGFKSDLWVIASALQISDIEYTFEGEGGVKIDLKPAQLQEFLKLGAALEYTVTSSGSLVVKTPVYLAFKETTYLAPVGQGAGTSVRPDPQGLMLEHVARKLNVDKIE